ncbi:TRAP transporter large permease subunit [Acuticoccus sp. I52.16.1]|uniref:TRAP transporter large permease subunit n=1 Tax=Acuticoccus sp. I52.16.1 TaxID=2928472 RepID=UPI001FCFE1E1|nr:TRAP transporter large permease subunit [Acuticoccus sp. I52.16.1]UOM33306.1 TRAP transporter large permease subunit [Acuticoccus sp. I52.16.1]
MSHEATLWFVGAWFVLALFLGQAVATCLFGAGLVGVYLWAGPRVLHGLVGQDIFYTASTFSLSIVPLYLLMAQILLKGDVIVDLFKVGRRLAGRRRLPLGVATILTGGMLGAVSGSGSASAASLAALAGPELERSGYTRVFSVGLAAIGGSLSAIIPPSIIVIVYGSMTLVPIGALFIASIGPAMLCMLVFIGCLWAFPDVKPEARLVDDQPIEKEPITAGTVASFIFVLFLMTVVFGSIYGGIVTVGEAGAMGAFAALVGMIVMRRVGLRDILEALTTSAKITAMLVLLVIAAQVFSRFLSFSQIPRQVLSLAEPLIDQPLLLVGVLMLVIFLAGMILESIAVIILLIPIVQPMLEAAQIDMLWFGILASFMISLGLLTPPVGLSTYAAASVAKLPVTQVFRPTSLFAFVAAVCVTSAMLFWPPLVTWLPANIR